MKLMKKIGFVGLGCDKNRVDLERMIGSISNNNFIISNDPDDCNVIIINTCAFIKSARDESEDAINEYSELKKQGKIAICVQFALFFYFSILFSLILLQFL